MSSGCPYCAHSVAEPDATGTRARPDIHIIVKCSNCGNFFARHANGRNYPLADRSDPDADVVTRVVDE